MEASNNFCTSGSLTMSEVHFIFKIYSFNLSEEGIKELEIVSKLYMNDKLEKEYKLEKLF